MAASSPVDVAVVGLGPVGGVLAVLLAAAGLDVAVIEPSPAVFPVPRAVALDDEVLRFLASVPGLPTLALVGRPRAEFTTASGRLLAALDFDGSRNGQPGLAFFHQPSLESALRALLAPHLVVDAVTSLQQSSSSLSLGLASGAVMEARYVVGCDGASSTVRRLLGIDFPGRTLARPWLVVDAVGEPIADTFRYICDPARPAVSMPVPGGHRWEWMCVAPYSPPIPPSLTVTRSVEYTFSARSASSWRVGRVLLAGDAAHTMPPFAGQGLGAGLRDVSALWWRLVAAVRSGVDSLDEYETERRPHVRTMTRTALLAGAVVQTQSRAGAAAVRGALRLASHSSWFAGGGMRPRDVRLLPNSRVECDGVIARVDDLLPFGQFVEVVLLPSGQVRVGEVAVTDVDGWLTGLLLRLRGGSALIRPDRVIG